MILKKNPSVIYSNLDSEVCLFNPNSGEYLNLNSTGSLIWDLLDKFSSFNSISKKLLEIFDTKEETIIYEFKNFINDSEKLGIIIVEEDS